MVWPAGSRTGLGTTANLGDDPMKMIDVLRTGVIACALFATAGHANAEMTEAGHKAMVAAGKIMFEQRCRSCHADDPAKKAYGPSLMGVVGRKAGSLEGFAYSDAMKNADITWTEETLRKWIADNDGYLPGTRMRHVGIQDKAEQDFLLAFIKTLK